LVMMVSRNYLSPSLQPLAKALPVEMNGSV